ncbi:MAG: glycosyltransferase family 2 protein [Bacteroidaceae bacterium]|nr:glycosyltransferase family 2 protein [Bacteroidaceae bacterium]
MPTPKVAILVAAYNAQATLDACLASLTGQTLRETEIICIDDCSTDATPDVLTRWAARDTRITLLRTPANSGQAVARNMGLERVSAPFVCMVDADDWLSADCLLTAYDVITRHPTTDTVAFSLILHYDDDGHETPYGLPGELAQGPVSGLRAFELCLDNWQLHGYYLVRTELHRRLPYDTATRLYSDDNTTRLHYLHSRQVRAAGGRYYWRQHAASMTHSFNLRRFDFMEANLSLKASLKDYERTHGALPAATFPLLERHRWYIFLASYRMYFNHLHEIPREERPALRRRLRAVLATFSRRELPPDCRRRPGYWLIPHPTLFHLQQWLFTTARRCLRLPLP